MHLILNISFNLIGNCTKCILLCHTTLPLHIVLPMYRHLWYIIENIIWADILYIYEIRVEADTSSFLLAQSGPGNFVLRNSPSHFSIYYFRRLGPTEYKKCFSKCSAWPRFLKVFFLWDA